jgi:osomolarity two-component system sensor histidine kinase SLN1
MRSLFIPLRMATDARGLELVTELDPAIDKVLFSSISSSLSPQVYLSQIARRAAYEAMGEGADAIAQHINEYPDVDGVVIGDESRLRQIITNLARYSTSCLCGRWT